MRIFLIAAAALALVTAPAAAQEMMGGKRHQRADQKADPNKEARRKAAEKAYNDALAKIPEPKEPYDPWKIGR
jgi:hypothetical protein